MIRRIAIAVGLTLGVSFAWAQMPNPSITTNGSSTGGGGGGGSGTPANPSALVGSVPVNGVQPTYMRSDSAPGLNTTGVVAGSYTNSNITVDANGRISSATNGSGAIAGNPTATVGSSATVGSASTYMRSDAAPALATTAVAAGSYTNTALTVDANGRLTAASSGTAPPAAANPTGTVSGVASNGSLTTFMRSDAAPALATTAVTPGGYTNTALTVDANGRITAASSGAATPTAANPTATVGSAAVNGSLTTFMRSDAAPALATTAVSPGSYTYATITVDANGRITAASNGDAPVNAANPTATVGSSAVNGSLTTYMRSDAAPALATTAVTPGSYTYSALTVDANGRLTAASSGAAPPAAANPTATISGSASNGSAATFMRSDAAPALATTAVTPGSYTNTGLTVDANGRITAASSGTAAPSAANPTATVSGVAVNGSAATFMRSDGAPALATTAVTPGSYTHSALTVDANGRITAASSGTAPPSAANPTATIGTSAVNGSAATFMRSDGAPAISQCSSSVFGACKVDGTSITATGGVISSNGGAGVGVQSGQGALGIDDSSTSIAAGHYVVYTNAAFTAARTWTLPDSATFGVGDLTVIDAQGTLTSANTLTLTAAGTNQINGGGAASSTPPIKVARGGMSLHSDGAGNWTVMWANTIGVQTVASNNFVTGIDASGVFTAAQPAFSNISGAVTAAQSLALTTNSVYQGNGSNQPAGVSLSAALDAGLGSTRGAILERGSGGWVLITPGTSGYALTSNGAGNDPSYQASGTGTINTGTGGQLGYYATTGTAISPLTVGTNLQITGGQLNATGGSGSGAQLEAQPTYSFLHYFPGLLTAVGSTKAAFHKVQQSSTVDALTVSANLFTCSVNPAVTLYECGTDTTCGSPTTLATATITEAGTAVSATPTSSAITAGDYVAFAISAGTCSSIDIGATAQVHSNPGFCGPGQMAHMTPCNSGLTPMGG